MCITSLTYQSLYKISLPEGPIFIAATVPLGRNRFLFWKNWQEIKFFYIIGSWKNERNGSSLIKLLSFKADICLKRIWNKPCWLDSRNIVNMTVPFWNCEHCLKVTGRSFSIKISINRNKGKIERIQFDL